MREASGVAEFLNEVARQFCQGNIDLRAAAEMRQCALAVLRTFEFEARNQREAARAAAPRTFSDKKLPFPIQFNVRDIVTGELYQSPNRKGHSAAEPPSPPGQQDPKPDTKENKPDQDRQQSVSPASAAGAKDQTKDHTEAQTNAQATAQPPAKAQQLNEQKEPKPNGQNKPQPNQKDEPQPNSHSAMSPAPPAAQPVSPPPKENQPVQYPPGLGPRYLALATPEMPWWRRPQFGNPGFVTGKVPQTAAMRAPAKRFRGTRR
jgi:hypothetical protein